MSPRFELSIRFWLLSPARATILVATSLPVADFAPEMVAISYRHRWQGELFFRWLKCILGCRRWLAESEAGVLVQVSLALIVAQLLVLYRGKRPNRRQMEAIQSI